MMKIKLLLLFATFQVALTAQPLQEYFFNNNFNGTAGGGALTEVLACGAGLGSFGTQTITTTAGFCSNTTAFCFNDGGGLSYPNNSITSQYTINLFCKFNALSGYTRVIDFSNGASDAGIYLLNDCLNLFPNGTIGPCPYFLPNLYYLFTFVRDGATNTISVYVNGTFFSSYVDATNLYRPATSTTPIIFFRDDTAVPCEAAPGCVGYASVSSGTLSAAQVNTVWVNICNTVSACTLTASPSASICSGGTASLGASGAVTYTWSPSAGLSSVNAASVTASPAATTVYTVSGTNGSGCTSSATVQVTVNAAPALTASPNATICAGNAATLSASGASSYTWAPGASLSASSGATVTATPATSTIYTITGASSSGCTSTYTLSLTVTGQPTLTATGGTLCSSSSVSLTASGASSYTWSPAAGLSATSGATVIATPSVTTSYTVSGNVGTCTGSAVVTASVVPLSVSVTSSSGTYCPGGSPVSLTASGASTYSWSPPAGLSATSGATVAASPAGTTTYTLTGTNGACSSTRTITVFVAPVSTLSISGTTLICPNGSGTTLTATGAASYTWVPGAQTSASIQVNPSVTTTYTVGGQGTTGCPAIPAVVTVSVAPAINASVSASSASVCLGKTVSLSATPTGAYTYTWQPAAAIQGSASFPVVVAKPSATPAVVYTVTVSNGSCQEAVTFSLQVFDCIPPQSQFTTLTNDSICTKGCVSFTATSTGVQPLSYQWLFPGGTPAVSSSASPVVCYNAPGTYSVALITGNPYGSDTLVAGNYIHVADTPSVRAYGDTLLSLGQSAPVRVTGNAGSYSWSPNNGTLACASCTNTIAQPTVTTLYIVTGSNSPYCKATDTVLVKVDFVCGDFFVPNAFSPNNDGLNDELNVHGFCIATFKLRIFNRWGELVFETSDKRLGWNGSYRGQAMDAGVFVYTVDGITIENKPFSKKGNVTLIR